MDDDKGGNTWLGPFEQTPTSVRFDIEYPSGVYRLPTALVMLHPAVTSFGVVMAIETKLGRQAVFRKGYVELVKYDHR